MFGTTGSQDYQKMLAAMLAKDATSSAPIQSPWQGADRMAKALLAGMQMQNASAQDKEFMAELAKFSGGGAPAMAAALAPQTAQTAPQMAPQAAPVPVDADAVTEAKTPQDYINRAWGGLTPQGRDVATRTVLGEAANQGPTGMAAVADVMRNRAVSGGYGGNTMDAVALAKNQFEPWNTPAGRQRMQSFSPMSPAYAGAQSAVDTAAIGSRPDVTGGASYFYAPKAQAALAPVDGRPVTPSFAQGQPSAVIGDHNFYRAPTQTAQAQPQQPQQQNNQNAMIDQWLKSSNPRLQQAGAALRMQQIQQQFKPSEYEYKPRDDGSIVAINKKNPNDVRLLQPPGGSQALIDFNAQNAAAKKGAELRAERAVTEPDRRKQEVQAGNIVVQDIDRALQQTNEATIPVTGMVGKAASYVPGTSAHNVSKLLDTVKANAGFDQLNKMRMSSPTGGALGNVTERELGFLQAVIGNLEQSQDEAQFKDNLKRVKNAYLDVIHGPGNGPREPLGFQGKKIGGQTQSGLKWSVD